MPIACQLKKIFRRPLKFIDRTRNELYITDVTDGEIYRRLLQSPDGERLESNEAFTFLINTDGVSVCTKSDLSIWPIFLSINEIEIKLRFCLENMVVAGMFVGSKPNFDVHLTPIMKELKALEYGIMMKQKDMSEKNISFLPHIRSLRQAAKEEIGRMTSMSLNVLKAFGTPKDIVEISQCNKDSDAMVGMARISTSYADVFMSTEKKKDLIAMLEAGLKLKHVFKATMLVFFPDEAYWETRNADSFFKQSTDLISATVEFVNEHQTTIISSSH